MTALHALGEAARLVERGDAGLVVVGGKDRRCLGQPQGKGADAAEQVGHGLGLADGVDHIVGQRLLGGLGRLQEAADRQLDLRLAHRTIGRLRLQHHFAVERQPRQLEPLRQRRERSARACFFSVRIATSSPVSGGGKAHIGLADRRASARAMSGALASAGTRMGQASMSCSCGCAAAYSRRLRGAHAASRGGGRRLRVDEAARPLVDARQAQRRFDEAAS